MTIEMIPIIASYAHAAIHERFWPDYINIAQIPVGCGFWVSYLAVLTTMATYPTLAFGIMKERVYLMGVSFGWGPKISAGLFLFLAVTNALTFELALCDPL